MSGKFQKKTKKNKNGLHMLLCIVVLLLAAAIGAMMILLPSEDKPAVEIPSTQTPTQLPDELPAVQYETVRIQETESLNSGVESGLKILDVGSYTGTYVEDGSDEVVSGVLMLKVANPSEDTVEFAKFTMQAGAETAEFTLSTLKPGATIVLLEKNRMVYDRNTDYAAADVVCENLAVFREPLKLHEDKLKIQILDGAINVTNLTQEDIPGRISIYYKNVASGIYYGGITYRITLDNGLRAGEIRQIMASHFSDTGSEIMFVTIAQ